MSIVAGAAGDNTPLETPWFHRPDFMSCSGVVCGTTTLAAAQRLDLKDVAIEHAIDAAGTGASRYQLLSDLSLVATGAGTVEFAQQWGADLSGAKLYVRLVATPDLSRANTDTAVLTAVLIMGGKEKLP